MIHEYLPTQAELAYTFAGRDPVGEIKPGQVWQIWTEDCFNGAVTSVDTLPTAVCQFPFLNPVTGPFHVDAAEPGDILAVHFAAMRPARDWGVSSTFPHFGALTSTHATATLQPALEERVWLYHLDPDAEVVNYQARNSDFTLAMPMAPMLGTVGVAPAGSEVRSTITAGAHGGNMDTPELRAGTTLYLPVAVPGALLGLGDGHARQGHGEASGVAVETAMHTTLAVDVIKNTPLATPRLESRTAIMSVGLARPLEDAYQLVAQAGQASIGNVCDPNYCVVAKLPKPCLPNRDVYGAVHKGLEDLTARALSEGT